MSQQQAIQQEEQQGQLPGNAGAVSADDDFYAGFDIDLDAAPASQSDGQQDAGKKEAQQTPQTEQVPQTPPQDAPQADPLDFFQADEPTAGQAAQQLPSPTQLTKRSRQMQPHRPRNLRRPARAPKLQQYTLDASCCIGDQSGGGGRTALTTREEEAAAAAFRQCVKRLQRPKYHPRHTTA